MKKTTLCMLVVRSTAFALAFTFFSVSGAYAYTILDMPGSNGLFRFQLLDPGELGVLEQDETDLNEEDKTKPSAFKLNEQEKASLVLGTEYWRLLLGDGAMNTSPLNIQVRTVDAYDDNASAYSPFLPNGPNKGQTYLAGALTGDWFGETGQDRDALMAFITINHGANPEGTWYSGPMGSLPQNGVESDLASTMLHELGHAFGMAANLDGDTDSQPASFYFNTQLSKWDEGLRDSNGNPAHPEQIIVGTPSSPNSGEFVTNGEVAYSGVYFTGKHVQETLNGALIAFASDPDENRTGSGSAPVPVPGLPINGWEWNPDLNTYLPEFSHVELQNSLMSHQSYRNWNTFMEAELAAMQDVGLRIDRRNWYGYSIYNSGTQDNLRSFTNTHPYYARNAQGEWIAGQPNATPWGTGLHVYGSWNNITQAADLLSSGTFGLGIRVDGSGNRISIAPGVRVQANGPGGIALLTAYGSNHTLIHRGDAQALGAGGIAARFDFGDNELGNNVEYRGSWIRSTGDYDPDTKKWTIDNDANLPDELKGALVESFDVSGRLAGQDAALYIGPSAWVEHVNIMNGATLQGNIISEWDPMDDRIQYTDKTGESILDLVTNLTFGLRADATGAATNTLDPNFTLRYDGHISGPKSLNMAVKGGMLSFNGTADLLSVEVDEGATLGGSANYRLNELTDSTNNTSTGGTFTNAGTLAPGNSLGTINITGDYTQTSTGRLAMEFDASGRTDRLNVTGNAELSGSLVTAPVRDYYNEPVNFAFSDMVTATTPVRLDPGFNVLQQVDANSPTLSMSMLQTGSGLTQSYTMLTKRAPNAYSRYAHSSNAAAVGHSLDTALNVQGDLRTIFAAMDFSAPDGNDVAKAMASLSPDAYGNAALAVLDVHRTLSDLLLTGTFSRSNGTMQNDELRVFVQPFAGYVEQARTGGFGYTASNAGGIAGVERSSNGLTLGGHAVFNYMNVDGDINGDLRGEGFYLGGQGMYAPEAWNGWNLFTVGRVGLENMRMERTLAFSDYDKEVESDWLGVSGSLRVGGGWEADFGTFRAGPFAAMDYAFSSRPSLTEDGAGGRLHLDSEVFHSLRSSIGGRIATEAAPLNEHATWQAHLSIAWNHELLNKAGEFHASFAEASVSRFANTVKHPGRDSLGLGAGLVLTKDTDFSLSLNAGSELFRNEGTSVYGNVAATWKF